MIDIHVLTHSGTRPEWLKQCLKSLEGHPVVVHVVEGIEGSVGAGRAKGFALGVCEFVGYVDSDDYVLDRYYDQCLFVLKKKHAVVGKEYVEYEDGSRHKFTKSGHNGAVYRRSDIDPLIKAMAHAPYTADALTREALRPYQLETVGYVWRAYKGGAHNMIDNKIIEMEKAQWLKQLS